MTNAEGLAAIESLPPGVCEAVDSLLEYARGVADDGFTVGDIAEGLRLAVANQGTIDTLMITLHMALAALQLLPGPEREG